MLTTFDWPDCAFGSYPVSYAKATAESDEMLKTKSRFPHLNVLLGVYMTIARRVAALWTYAPWTQISLFLLKIQAFILQLSIEKNV